VYSPDGCGRDYYIKFDNGGYWADQFQIKKVPDYERPRYKNFHTLYHQAAPFKYWGNGHGRETYIIKGDGFFHEQKPLCSYKLSDFLRNGRQSSLYDKYKKKVFMSVSEKKYNNELRQLEKRLIKRLYTEPMNSMKSSLTISKNDDKYPEDKMRKTFTAFPRKERNYNVNNYCLTEVVKTADDSSFKNNTIDNIDKGTLYTNSKKSNNYNKYNKTFANFYKKYPNVAKNKLEIKSDKDFHIDVTKRTFNNLLDYNKISSTIKNNRPQNVLRFIEPRSQYNNAMKVAFNFKPKPKSDKIKIKKLIIS
jgi:hypothetical protein